MASEIYQGNEQNKRFYNAFALSGRRAKCDDTQGVGLQERVTTQHPYRKFLVNKA